MTKWIRCEDRLPTKQAEYLTYVEDKNDVSESHVDVNEWLSDQNCWAADWSDNMVIKLWAYCPKPKEYRKVKL
jgi:hypothetical protein